MNVTHDSVTNSIACTDGRAVIEHAWFPLQPWRRAECSARCDVNDRTKCADCKAPLVLRATDEQPSNDAILLCPACLEVEFQKRDDVVVSSVNGEGFGVVTVPMLREGRPLWFLRLI